MRAIIGAAALLGAAAAATAADAPQDAAAFGAREYIRDASLSPDGTKIALVTAGRGLGEDLLIVDMVAGGDPRPITATSGDPEHLTDCT